MKKCPYCCEDIQDAANICKHCGRNQAIGKAADSLIPDSRQSSALDAFEKFMVSYGSGWVLINKTERLVSYQRIIAGSKGSCLIALILLMLIIIPGLLYLYFANRSGKINQLTVTLSKDGTLMPSGDADGLKLYQKFLKS